MVRGMIPAPYEHTMGEVFVYREKDLADILKTAELANGLLSGFQAMLQNEPDKRDEIYHSLCGEPRVREALDRLVEGRKTQPEVPER